MRKVGFCIVCRFFRRSRCDVVVDYGRVCECEIRIGIIVDFKLRYYCSIGSNIFNRNYSVCRKVFVGDFY